MGHAIDTDFNRSVFRIDYNMIKNIQTYSPSTENYVNLTWTDEQRCKDPIKNVSIYIGTDSISITANNNKSFNIEGTNLMVSKYNCFNILTEFIYHGDFGWATQKEINYYNNFTNKIKIKLN